MSPSHNKVIAVICVCLALTSLVLAIKISMKTLEMPQTFLGLPMPTETLKTDYSFTEPSDKTPTKDTKVTTKPKKHPEISAKAYLVGDIETGKIYIEENSSEVLPVASMSKLITAIAATDTLSPDARVTLTEAEMQVATDTARLYTGETFTVQELLYPLLLSSSNVVAEALASTTDRINFLELMSSYAWEVGMPDTFFADPSGLSSKNISTAKDFFALAKYLYSSRQDLLSITRNAEVLTATTTDHGGHDFISTHPFATDPRFIGGKTGRTDEAGETMLTILNINNKPTAFIVLGSLKGKREADTRVLIDLFNKIK